MADREFLPLPALVKEHVVPLNWHTPFRRTDEWLLTIRVARSIAALHDHVRECAAQIDSGGFDILFANTCQMVAAPPIGRYAKTPSVLYLQEPARSLYEAQPTLCWAAKPDRATSRFDIKAYRAAIADLREIRNLRLLVREEADNARAYERILVNSYFSRESILRAYGLDCDVCYLGIDTAKFADLHLPREDYVVGLSSMHPSKNIRFCIEAIGAMPAPRPRLVWIANFALPAVLAELSALAEQHGVVFEPRIRISDEELINTLNGAFAMVYAPRLEPFGLSPLEAGACGVPVVAVAEGGVRETIIHGENGLLVEPRPTAMANALQQLRDDPAYARSLGERALQHVDLRWNLDSATDRIESHLRTYARPRSREEDRNSRAAEELGLPRIHQPSVVNGL